jgi:hypothetical protein
MANSIQSIVFHDDRRLNDHLLPNDLGSLQWIASELGNADLGDQRLNKRLVEVAQDLYAQPEAPINQACEDWAAAKAAYRFFENERVSARDIFLPHQAKTIERIARQPLVLHIQDTTYLNYTRHPSTTGLGPIGTSKQPLRGLVMHNTLSITPSGLPLGVLTHTIWARAEQPHGGGRAGRRKKSIEEKESRKWIDALEESARVLPKGVRDVTICDAESDIFEMFLTARQLHKKILVRACQDRCLLGEEHKLWDFMASQPLTGQYEVDVSAPGPSPARTAVVTVRLAHVALKTPRNTTAEMKRRYPSIDVAAIYVQELDPPPEVEAPLEWMLLTNVATTTFEDAIERIEWYKRRWTIEIFHKVLKSGCHVENVQFDTAQRIERYLALFLVIGYRILWLRDISRVHPDAPCSAVLAPHEWKALYAKIHRSTELPEVLPTARQVVRWIGALGGHLGRKRDGEPGVTAIWRGWQRLTDLAELRLIYYPEPYATSASADPGPAGSSAPQNRPVASSAG